MTMIQLLYNKKEIRFKVKRMTIYNQAKIIEVIGKSQLPYLLFFYKNNFINVKKTPAVKLHSFLRHALQYGESYHANHPLTKAMLATNKEYRILSNHQMIQKLNKQYNETEKIFILSMLDNYLDEKKLQSLCKQKFYDYRRSGQLKKAFTFIINYAQFRPHDRFAHDMVHHFDFQDHKNNYQNMDQLIQDWSDPLYIEAYYFRQNFPEKITKLLVQHYKKENRLFDHFYLLFKKGETEGDIEALHEVAQRLLAEEDQIVLWGKLLENHPESQAILDKLMAAEGYHVLLPYLLQHPEAISNQELVENTILSVSAPLLAAHFSPLLSELRQLKDNSFSEKMLNIVIRKLLTHLSPQQILTEAGTVELPITQKLKKIVQLADNPDKQFLLGEIYFELEQYDRAIECFEWEMELAPDTSAPVQYLYQCYLAKGDKEQANSYKQLMASIS